MLIHPAFVVAAHGRLHKQKAKMANNRSQSRPISVTTRTCQSSNVRQAYDQSKQKTRSSPLIRKATMDVPSQASIQVRAAGSKWVQRYRRLAGVRARGRRDGKSKLSRAIRAQRPPTPAAPSAHRLSGRPSEAFPAIAAGTQGAPEQLPAQLRVSSVPQSTKRGSARPTQVHRCAASRVNSESTCRR